MKLGDICDHCNLQTTEKDRIGYGSTDYADPCLGKLPGVRYACCGHGEKNGYILFENETLVRITTGTVENFSTTGPLYDEGKEPYEVPRIKFG